MNPPQLASDLENVPHPQIDLVLNVKEFTGARSALASKTTKPRR